MRLGFGQGIWWNSGRILANRDGRSARSSLRGKYVAQARRHLRVRLGERPRRGTVGAGGRPGFVFPAICCYYNGAVVRTVVPPAAFPNEGRDNFYAVMGQEIFGVVGVAPGAPGYHGGHWKFHSVTWNVAPYLLTSEAAILAAQSSGDVTVTRVPENDFLCPIQP